MLDSIIICKSNDKLLLKKNKTKQSLALLFLRHSNCNHKKEKNIKITLRNNLVKSYNFFAVFFLMNTYKILPKKKSVHTDFRNLITTRNY